MEGALSRTLPRQSSSSRSLLLTSPFQIPACPLSGFRDPPSRKQLSGLTPPGCLLPFSQDKGSPCGVQDKGVLGKLEGKAPAQPSQDHARSGSVWHQPFPEERTRMNPLVEDSRNLLLGRTWQLPPSVQECHLGVVMSSRECFCLFPALLRPWDGAGMDSAASSRHLLLLRADQARRAGKLPTEGRERKTRERSPGEERWRGRGESKASHGRAGGVRAVTCSDPAHPEHGESRCQAPAVSLLSPCVIIP